MPRKRKLQAYPLIPAASRAMANVGGNLLRTVARAGVNYARQNPGKVLQKSYEAAKAAAGLVNRLKSQRKPMRAIRALEPSTQGNTSLAPVAVGRTTRFRPPRTSCAMKHTNSEFISTITSSAVTNAFSATEFQVNPGFANVFPWLSTEALRWQQYKFTKLQFRFVTRQATSTAGSVIMAPIYNVLELAPTTEQLATNTANAIEDVVWKNITCKVDCSSGHAFGARKMVRDSSVAGDLANYDMCNFFISTVGLPSLTVIGKLWVDYTVEFYGPVTLNAEEDQTRGSYYSSHTQYALTSGVSVNASWDTAKYAGLGESTTGSPISTFTFPKGHYVFTSNVSFNSTLATNVQTWFTYGGVIQQDTTAFGTCPATGYVELTSQIMLYCDGLTSVALRVLTNQQNATDFGKTLTVVPV